jgi:hypothetical protein
MQICVDRETDGADNRQTTKPNLPLHEAQEMSHKLLAVQSAILAAKYPTAKTEEDEAWEGSPFVWFRKKASSTKGKIGRDLATSILEAAGFAVDRVGVGLEANGKTIRVKLSLMGGCRQFYVRADQGDRF